MTKVPPKYNALTPALAVACETICVNKLKKSNTEVVARISVVNSDGECVYDTFIKPTKKVTVYNYRTHATGITSEDLVDGEDFIAVREVLKKLLRGRIAVGHSIAKHLALAGYNHLKKLTRDITEHGIFRETSDIPSLKSIAKEKLDIEIKDSPSDTVADARVAMTLYQSIASAWDASFESDSDDSSDYCYRYDSSDYFDSDWIC